MKRRKRRHSESSEQTYDDLRSRHMHRSGAAVNSLVIRLQPRLQSARAGHLLDF